MEMSLCAARVTFQVSAERCLGHFCVAPAEDSMCVCACLFVNLHVSMCVCVWMYICARMWAISHHTAIKHFILFYFILKQATTHTAKVIYWIYLDASIHFSWFKGSSGSSNTLFRYLFFFFDWPDHYWAAPPQTESASVNSCLSESAFVLLPWYSGCLRVILLLETNSCNK